MARFIDKFEVILLDMGQTFMFNVDRFSECEDFGATYRQVGGQRLTYAQVRRIILNLFDRLQSYSRDSSFYNDFPTVLSCLENSPDTASFDRTELETIEQVFALHEIGTVPTTHVTALRQLR